MSKSSSSTRNIQWDLLLTGIVSFLLTLLISFTPSQIWLKSFRLILGLLFVLFLPGYWLAASLFPKREELDGVERIGLSLGLSIAWIPVLVLILDRLPWGFQVQPIIIGEIIFVVIFMGVALIRRSRLSSEVVFVPEVVHPRAWWRSQPKSNQHLYIIVTGALGFALLAIAWVLLTPSPADFMTEFFLLGTEGLAENYPREAVVGETVSITAGITNRESEDHSYSIEVWVEDSKSDGKRERTGAVSPINLEEGETIEFPIQWDMPWAGEDQIVEFLLFIDDEPTPYRKLRLWLDVEEIENSGLR